VCCFCAGQAEETLKVTVLLQIWRQTWTEALEVSRSLSTNCFQVLLGRSYLKRSEGLIMM